MQEFDNMRVLSKLPLNSELYRYKMDQYKEASTIRGEVEKVLQEQRVEKIRRDFEKQKYEDERRYNHDKWLEEQKREILAAKLKQSNTPGNTMHRNQSLPEIRRNNGQIVTAYDPPGTSRHAPPSSYSNHGNGGANSRHNYANFRPPSTRTQGY